MWCSVYLHEKFKPPHIHFVRRGWQVFFFQPLFEKRNVAAHHKISMMVDLVCARYSSNSWEIYSHDQWAFENKQAKTARAEPPVKLHSEAEEWMSETVQKFPKFRPVTHSRFERHLSLWWPWFWLRKFGRWGEQVLKKSGRNRHLQQVDVKIATKIC